LQWKWKWKWRGEAEKAAQSIMGEAASQVESWPPIWGNIHLAAPSSFATRTNNNSGGRYSN